MAKQEKFITSHRFRVERAKKKALELPEKISIFDREALVEFFLLEDIERLYKFRYDKIRGKKKETKEGIFFQKKQLEKIHYLLYMLKKCIEVMEGKIDEGRYNEVWKAIHEHQLMVAAGNLKYLDDLVGLTENMLGDIDGEALELAKKKLKSDEFLEELIDHDANVRSMYDLPSADEIDGSLDSVDIISPEDKYDRIKKSNPNIN